MPSSFRGGNTLPRTKSGNNSRLVVVRTARRRAEALRCGTVMVALTVLLAIHGIFFRSNILDGDNSPSTTDALFPNNARRLPATTQSSFPKIIWTYWDNADTVPTLVKLCLWSWQVLNPSWELRLLTLSTTGQYISKSHHPSFEAYLLAADSPARLTDFVRLAVLEEYGGVWADASTLPVRGLDEWLVTEQVLLGSGGGGGDRSNKNNAVGGKFSGTTAAYRRQTNTVFQLRSWNSLGRSLPLIESWFMAAWPQSPLISAWKRQFDRLLTESVDEFLRENREDRHLDFQYMGMPEYLTIHVAAQRAIQDDPALMEPVVVHDAEDGPFRQLIADGWDSDKFCRHYFVPNLHLDVNDAVHRMDQAPAMLLQDSGDDSMRLAQEIVGRYSFDARYLFIKIRGAERGVCDTIIQEQSNEQSNQ